MPRTTASTDASVPPFLLLSFLLAAGLVAWGGCAPSEAGTAWEGRMDTLPSGTIVVENTADPVWTENSAWRVVEELRIGSVEGEGPTLFGRIRSLAVDAAGRVWVVESQSQEIRVFGRDGGHVRTIGRKGGGPGEFQRALHAQFGPEGRLWVADPANARVSVFDTAGALLTSEPVPGGFVVIPWRGGFDDRGRYYLPIPRPSEEGFDLGLVRHEIRPDSTSGRGGRTAPPALVPLDTLPVPRDPVERERFEHRSGDGRTVAMASVPYAPAFRWRRSPSGTFWGLFTGDYRLVELSPAGDTLRAVTRPFEPLPVTQADVEEAMEGLEWFTSQGGWVDRSAIPDTKPGADELFVDDEGNVWVFPVTERGREGRVLDVFDPEGRWLGRVRLPFALADGPVPLVRGGVLYGVTENELEVPFVVRARIEKPGEG